MPSGTQSNLVALMSHCQRGDEYIVGQQQHCYRWEAGGAAVLGSIQPQPLPQQADGTLALADIEAAIKPDDPHFARSRLLCLENTIGGQVLGADYLAQAQALARSRGLALHLDGARLFNAAAATPGAVLGNARAICAGFDSVSVCFSKGLGAPVGSVLCGSAELIARARRWRKMCGGGMRQAGGLAAAALYALDHHLERLREDHALARRLAEGLQGIAGLSVSAPQTNIVFADLAPELAQRRGAGLLAHLAEHGVLATGLYRLRFVTHLDVDTAGLDHAIAVLRRYLEN
jgi:threonine aldolase